jgi:hypothetical protein
MNLRRVIVIVATTAAALIFRLAAGHTPAVGSGSQVQHVGAAAVVVTALVAGLAAWGLLAWLERRSPRGRVIWRAIAAPVLVLSLAGTLGGVTTTDKLMLVALHLIVGLPLIALLPGAARRPATRPETVGAAH